MRARRILTTLIPLLALSAACTVEVPEFSDRQCDPAGAGAFTEPGGDAEGALPILSVPRQIAGATLYRDLHAFYAAKDELFPERTSGLIFFENMMGIFFTGRDLTDEVLGETLPQIRVVVAEQAYDSAVGTPAVQVPAFAVVFREQSAMFFREVQQDGSGFEHGNRFPARCRFSVDDRRYLVVR